MYRLINPGGKLITMTMNFDQELWGIMKLKNLLVDHEQAVGQIHANGKNLGGRWFS